MKCPFCGKKFEFDPEDPDTLTVCKFCNKRFNEFLSFPDFLNSNANLFTIMGIFAAIAVLLPQIAGFKIISVNTWIQGDNFSISNSPLPILIPNQELFISISVLSSWFLMVLIGLTIIINLSSRRDLELIYYDCNRFTLRNGDMVRIMFLIPFLALGLSFTLYILSLFWNLFQTLEICFILGIIVFFGFILIQNRPMLQHIIKENQK